jgi:flagellin
MGLRIKTNLASQMAQKSLSQATKNEGQALNKLSTGKRITKSADDAAGLAIATNINAQVKGLKQAKRNANDGISLVQVAEGGLQETTNILTRLRELSIQAASDTISDVERGFLDKEYQNLVEETDRIAQTTKFNGVNLINGEGKGDLDFHVGAFGGKENVVTFNSSKSDASAETLGVSGTGVSSKDDARSSIENVDKALESVSEYRADLGAVQSRLTSTVSNLSNQALNMDAARSRIEDVDMAEASAELASAKVIKAAGISTLAQSNNIPSSALRLIG